MNEHFKQALIALNKEQMTLLSYANNHNIQTRLLSHFVMNIVPRLSNSRSIAFMEYKTKKSKKSDVIILKDYIDKLLKHFDYIPNNLYNRELIDFNCLYKKPYLKNDGKYIGFRGFNQPINKTFFNVNDTFNVIVNELNRSFFRFKIIQKISVKNKFDTLYDIYYKNGVKYITSFELTDILLVDPQETTKHTILQRKTEPFNSEVFEKRLDDWCANEDEQYKLLQMIEYDELMGFFDVYYSVNIYEIFIEAVLKQLEMEEDKTEYNDTIKLLGKAKQILFCDNEYKTELHYYKLKRYSFVLRFFLQARNNMFFTGLYEIKTKPFYESKINNRKIKITNNFIVNDKRVDTADALLEHTSKELTLEKHFKVPKITDENEWNNTRSIFVYQDNHTSFTDKPILNDDELICLFEPKLKKKKKKRKKKVIEDDSSSQDDEPQDEEQEQDDDKSNNIYFYATQIEQEEKNKIQYLLDELCSNNSFFNNMLNDNYNTIRIIKSIDKSYTTDKYINFSFGNCRKQYHAYLNILENAFTNITYIASIKL